MNKTAVDMYKLVQQANTPEAIEKRQKEASDRCRDSIIEEYERVMAEIEKRASLGGTDTIIALKVRAGELIKERLECDGFIVEFKDNHYCGELFICWDESTQPKKYKPKSLGNPLFRNGYNGVDGAWIER